MTDLFEQAQQVNDAARRAEYATGWNSPERVDRRDAVRSWAFDLMGGPPAMSDAEREAFRLILAEQPASADDALNRHEITDDQLRRLVTALKFARPFWLADYRDHVLKRREGGVEPIPFRQWMAAA